jgi:DNA-binding LacI/PurR family transcriptional regulator
MSDRMALTALDWLRERGIDVPGQVSVVGFDGVPESAVSVPPLTTVAQPIIEMGRRAVRAILDFDGTVQRETLDVEFLVRDSTAPPPGS